ncbi:MAG: FAD-dependent oxidoreductase [Chloroflexi bacterium]|nr:FAD-dependent oxidoreductase [Chloroflexota bacterium]
MKELMATDVLVVGGGPAGTGAALAAARAGAETLLIEKHAFFGGAASFCLGMPINQMRPGGRPRSHIHELVMEKLLAYGDLAVMVGAHEVWCNVEYLKVAVLDALDAVGCRYLVHAHVVDSLVENDRVTGVVVATKRGLMTIRSKTVVDCSGDADVAYFAGAEVLADQDQAAPMTLCLNVTNVDLEEAQAWSRAHMGELVEQARERYPLIPARWGLSRYPSSTCLFINHGGTKGFGLLDPTDPVQLSRAECDSRRQALQMVHAMREFGGEVLKGIEIVATGPEIGIRPWRRIRGLYQISEEDAKTGRKHDDAVAWRSGFLDIGFVRFERMMVHDVPYRCLLPEKLDGLLAAGRAISATYVGASAGKSMGNCLATGHAAGLAAALCAEKGLQPRELDVRLLQDALRRDGVNLDRAGDPQEWLTD